MDSVFIRRSVSSSQKTFDVSAYVTRFVIEGFRMLAYARRTITLHRYRSMCSSVLSLSELTNAAVDDVNANTPAGIHFEHTEVKTELKHISCGTYYLI